MRSAWTIICCLLSAMLLTPAASAADDWPVWRGPNGNGVAAPGQTFATRWSDDSPNIRWKVPVPGRGHSSPIVFGERIVLTTADEQTQVQSVHCFNRQDGAELWKVDVNRGNFNPKIHSKNTHATPTAAFDGERILVTFDNNT